MLYTNGRFSEMIRGMGARTLFEIRRVALRQRDPAVLPHHSMVQGLQERFLAGDAYDQNLVCDMSTCNILPSLLPFNLQGYCNVWALLYGLCNYRYLCCFAAIQGLSLLGVPRWLVSLSDQTFNVPLAEACLGSGYEASLETHAS